MPKLKSNKGVAKRFRWFAKGTKIKRTRAGKIHLLTGRSRKRKRRARHGAVVSARDYQLLRLMMPRP